MKRIHAASLIALVVIGTATAGIAETDILKPPIQSLVGHWAFDETDAGALMTDASASAER